MPEQPKMPWRQAQDPWGFEHKEIHAAFNTAKTNMENDPWGFSHMDIHAAYKTEQDKKPDVEAPADPWDTLVKNFQSSNMPGQMPSLQANDPWAMSQQAM